MSARAGAVVVVVAALVCEGATFPFSNLKENGPLERALRMIDTERTRRSDFGDLMMESGEESDQLSLLLFERQFGTQPEFVRQLRHRRPKSKEKKRGKSKEKKRKSKEKKPKGSKEKKKKKKKHSKEKRPHSRERDPWYTTSVAMTTPLSTATFEESTLSSSTSSPTSTLVPTTTTTTSPTTPTSFTATTSTSFTSTTSTSFSSTSNDPRFPEGMPDFLPDAETIEPFI
nr:integumentary mucin C.1-like [Penaeus vannamei]